MSEQLIMVRYAKSSIGYPERQKQTVRSLGLRRLGDTAIHADSPAVRGMISSVVHLVEVTPVDAAVRGIAKGSPEEAGE
jgi:large subunit ribosomal protein L30